MTNRACCGLMAVLRAQVKRLSRSEWPSVEETAKQFVGRVGDKYARAGRAAPTKIQLYYRAVEDGHLPPYPTPRIPPSRL